MKATELSAHAAARVARLLAVLTVALAAIPVRAAGDSTLVPSDIWTDTTWTAAGSPYLVDTHVTIHAGVTLTIEPGVSVESYLVNWVSYAVIVEGTLLAQGTAAEPIVFHTTPDGWSGVGIFGAEGNINQGSILEYVILDGGGSDVGANLILDYAEATVRHCQFNNGLGDGIAITNAGPGKSTAISDSSFTGNAGFALDLQDGTADPVLSNLSATGNGPALPYGGDGINVNDGILHGPHTWEAAGLPYLVLQTYVGADGELTLEPGVQVRSYPGNDNLDVQGRLIAAGTTGQPIHFEALDPVLGWSGLAIDGSPAQPSAGNVLAHTIVTGGGHFWPCSLYVQYGDITVTNSEFSAGAGSGVCADHGAVLDMADTVLTGNAAYPLEILDLSANWTLARLSASFNDTDTIAVGGGTITGSRTFYRSGINTYDVRNGNPVVGADGTLTIEPGVTVRFENGRDLTVHGTLRALGTPSDEVLFTGEEPDPRWWIGISLVGTPERHAVAEMRDTTIQFTGYGGGAMIGVTDADLILEHCRLRYAGDGVVVYPGGRAPDAGAVRLWRSQMVLLEGDAIVNWTAAPVQAAHNWWGSPTGPAADDNPGGTGCSIFGPVAYRPWLSAPNGAFVFLSAVQKGYAGGPPRR